MFGLRLSDSLLLRLGKAEVSLGLVTSHPRIKIDKDMRLGKNTSSSVQITVCERRLPCLEPVYLTRFLIRLEARTGKVR